jgi:hypothetical protein
LDPTSTLWSQEEEEIGSIDAKRKSKGEVRDNLFSEGGERASFC